MVFGGQAPIYGGSRTEAVSTSSMLRVDCDRWGQTPEDLRQLATSAAHQRTRERFLALHEVTQASCATEVATRTRRHPANQAPQGPAWRRVSAGYRRGRRGVLGSADDLAKTRLDRGAKSGRRPPVRRKVSASGPRVL